MVVAVREKLLQGLKAAYPQMVQWRREFHQWPELSFQEERTPRRIAEILGQFGIPVRTGVGGRGVVGVIEGGRPGPTVALRADFDALPIQEENEVPYRSRVPGVMHACGHDGHTAALLGVAQVWSSLRQELPGRLVLIHQFAEEVTPGGAQAMIADGCLDGVDAIFGTHLWSGFPLGSIGIKAGEVMAASDEFEILIRGKGGHGAMPHETVDAIVVGSHVVTQLQTLVSRKVNPLYPAVVTVGSFQAGETFNVIAEQALLKGTVRTYHPAVQDLLEQEMKQLVSGVCAAYGARCEVRYQRGYPAVVNHERETFMVTQVVREVMGEEAVYRMEPLTPGEDFAYYLQKVPGCFFFTGCRNEEIGAHYPHHHPRFNMDERAILHAAQILALSALSYMSQEE